MLARDTYVGLKAGARYIAVGLDLLRPVFTQ